MTRPQLTFWIKAGRGFTIKHGNRFLGISPKRFSLGILKKPYARKRRFPHSVRGLEDSFAVERKSIDDLANCCLSAQRERFERELHRLRGYRFKRLLVIGTREDIAAGRYHSRIAPKAVLATLGAFEIRYDLPIVFAATPASAAREIEGFRGK
jgi:hypothetical protein